MPDYSRCRLYLRQSTPLRGAKLWRHWFQPKTAWNFATISVATSASLLILLGMLLVELRLTGAFFWMFLAVGALSLAIQIVSFVIQIISFQARTLRRSRYRRSLTEESSWRVYDLDPPR